MATIYQLTWYDIPVIFNSIMRTLNPTYTFTENY